MGVIALLGTSYAYWTDSITISGAVSTGNLEVILEKTLVLSDPTPTHTYYVKNTQGDTSANGYTRTAVPIYIEQEGYVPAEVKDNEIIIDVQNLHPGTGIFIPFDLVNKSTMPVRGKVTVDEGGVGGWEHLKNVQVNVYELSSQQTFLATGYANDIQGVLNQALKGIYKIAAEYAVNASLVDALYPSTSYDGYMGSFVLEIFAENTLDEETLLENVVTSEPLKLKLTWHQWNDPEVN